MKFSHFSKRDKLYLTLALVVAFIPGAITAAMDSRAPVPDKPVVCVLSASIQPMPTDQPIDENTIIEAALLAHGYFRDDVPMTYELQDFLHTACEEHSVPYALALGLIEVESGFQPDAISPAGCYGLCQLNPAYFLTGLTPAENISAGIGFLGDLIADHGTESALTMYNSWRTGPSDYSRLVMAAAERWEAEP